MINKQKKFENSSASSLQIEVYHVMVQFTIYLSSLSQIIYSNNLGIALINLFNFSAI